MKKEYLLLILILIIFSECGSDPRPQKKETQTKDSIKSDFENEWTGTWAFNDGYVDYKLTISEDYGDRHLCVLEATGIQSYYLLECAGLVEGNSIQLKFPTVKDGNLLQKDRIIPNDPILTLTKKEGKTVTYWNQLVNNCENNRDGEVCFVKTKKQGRKEKENFDEIIEDLRKHDSFNKRSSWEERGLNQSGKEIIEILNNAKEHFLKEIQLIKTNYKTEEERLLKLNELVDDLPWDELDTEEKEFMTDELAPAIEALGFDPVIVF